MLFEKLGRPEFSVRDHIEKVIVIVVLLSIAPGIWAWLRGRLTRKLVALEEPVTADTSP